MKMVDYRTPRTGFVTNVLFWLALGITLGVVGSTLYALAMIVAAAIGHSWWGSAAPPRSLYPGLRGITDMTVRSVPDASRKGEAQSGEHRMECSITLEDA